MGSMGPPSVVSGVAGQYEPKAGVAVYRDLAGNIKQVCFFSNSLQLKSVCIRVLLRIENHKISFDFHQLKC